MSASGASFGICAIKAPGGGVVSAADAFGLVVSLLVSTYLLYALLRGERL